MALEEVKRKINMIKYKITEHIKTINIYKLDLNDEFVQKLNVKIQTEYANEQGQTIPYIDLNTLIDILKYHGKLEEINTNRTKNHKAPLQTFEVKKRDLVDTPNQLLYNVIVDIVDDTIWSSAYIDDWDSYLDDWYAEIEDENEN